MIITFSTIYYTALGANIFSSICLILLIVQYYIYRKRFNRLENAMITLRNELRQLAPIQQQSPAMPLSPTNPASIQQFRNWPQ